MESIAHIYGIKSHNSEIRYVGATTRDISARLSEHFALARKGHPLPLYRWIRKHMDDAIEIVLLETTSRSLVAEREYYWIKALSTYSRDRPRGLNCTLGGEGFSGASDTQKSSRSRSQKSTESLLKDSAISVSTHTSKSTQSTSKRVRLTNDNKTKICGQYVNEGHTVRDLSSLYGVSTQTVYAILKSSGVKLDRSRASKGRKYPVGEDNFFAVLTAKQVSDIRGKYKKGGITHKSLALEHNVSKSTIGAVLRGETWC